MKITCIKCGKKTDITAKKGNLCYKCWKSARVEKRKHRINTTLDNCFSYVGKRKISKQEAKIINDVMQELNKTKKE